MPKLPTYKLTWSAEAAAYQLFAHGTLEQTIVAEHETRWLSWLEDHSSCTFQGRQGHMSLLKEARARGEGYWYAYSYTNKRTRKRYLGPSSALSFALLEDVAHSFQQEDFSLAPTPTSAPLRERAPKALTAAPVPHLPMRESKLALPYLSATLVERPRLIASLNAALEYRLTLLTAPTGFGKTTLVAQWLRTLATHPEQPISAWLSLAEEDNQSGSFWRYISAACQQLQPAQESVAGKILAAHGDEETLEQALMLLANELATLRQPALLVIDNYAVITAQCIHERFAAFLEQLTPMLHIVLLSRGEPPLPLLRWRARGELYDLRTGELRFSQEETADFLRGALSCSCSEEALRKIDTRMEGWVAGLRLLVLALRGKQTPQQIDAYILSMLQANDSLRSVQDYFVSELFESMSEEMQLFLLQTSLLPRLSGSLCDALTRRADSALLLETLKRGGYFLEELDLPGEPERWYRYYSPFADAMQAEAQRRRGVMEMRSLALSACQWFEAHELFAEAIDLALRYRDCELAATIIERLAEARRVTTQEHSFDFHELDPLYTWMEQIPEVVLRRHPALCFSYACVLLYSLVIDQVQLSSSAVLQMEHCLSMAQEAWEADGNLPRLGEVLSFRAMLARQYGALEQAVSLAKRSLEYLSDQSSRWRMLSLSILAVEIWLSGQVNQARQLFEPRYPFPIPLPMTPQGRAFVRPGRIMFSRVCIEQLDFQQAEALLCQVLAEARADQDDDDISDAQLGLAQVSYVWNDLETAEQQAREALVLSQKLGNEENRVHAALLLVQIQQRIGGVASALQLCQELLSWVQPNGIPLRSWLHRAMLAQQAQLHLASGDLAAVERWIGACQQYEVALPLLQVAQEELLIARWQIARGAFTEAQVMLGPALRGAEEEGRRRIALEITLLLALTASAQKRSTEAKQLMQRVLEQASIANYQRLLLNEGPSIVPLIQSCLPTLKGELLLNFVRTLLQTLAQEQGEHPAPLVSLTELLSVQELRVLRLLVAGRSNPEIARELVVSVNTVKSHAQNIYRKLNVESRLEASKVARHLNLL